MLRQMYNARCVRHVLILFEAANMSCKEDQNKSSPDKDHTQQREGLSNVITSDAEFDSYETKKMLSKETLQGLQRLVNDPNYADQREELKGVMDQFMQSTQDFYERAIDRQKNDAQKIQNLMATHKDPEILESLANYKSDVVKRLRREEEELRCFKRQRVQAAAALEPKNYKE